MESQKELPKKGSIWKHYKTGDLYCVLYIGRSAQNGTDEKEPQIIYQKIGHEEEDPWIRSFTEWSDIVVDDGICVKRFEQSDEYPTDEECAKDMEAFAGPRGCLQRTRLRVFYRSPAGNLKATKPMVLNDQKTDVPESRETLDLNGFGPGQFWVEEVL